MNEERKPGRPKGECNIRDTRISGYLTKEDAEYVRKVADALGFTSTSEMITAIFERLCVGGFSAMVFAKLGWQFSNLLSNKKVKPGFYFGIRPLPPLLGEEPNKNNLSQHLDEMTREVREKGIPKGENE